MFEKADALSRAVKKAQARVKKWKDKVDDVEFHISSKEEGINRIIALLEQEEMVAQALDGRLPNEIISDVVYYANPRESSYSRRF